MKIKIIAYIIAAIGFTYSKAHAFGSPEHRDIGDSAWKVAIDLINKTDPSASGKLLAAANLSATKGIGGKKDEPICAVANFKPVAYFSFGDLVAIYGDFVKDTAEMNNAAIAGRAPALKQIATDGNLKAYPAEKERMMELAKVNVTHFSGEAFKAYVTNHDLALTAAAEKSRIYEALHYEALALHSFTDLFAFGHMLEDRELTAKLVVWALKENNAGSLAVGNMGSSVMGGMVNFYHNAGNFNGAMVKNAAGDQWRAYGDGKYFGNEFKDQRDVIVKAAAASLWSVMNVALGNALPGGTRYEATKYLPFEYWDAKDPIHPKDQKVALGKLVAAMQLAGRPIQDNGFDFSMGYLKYLPEEKKGSVKYLGLMTAIRGK